MKKNITDRTIDAVSDMLNGMSAELASIIHDVPYETMEITDEKKEAIEFFNKLTDEEKLEVIEVDGKRYIRKVWEKNHPET